MILKALYDYYQRKSEELPPLRYHFSTNPFYSCHRQGWQFSSL